MIQQTTVNSRHVWPDLMKAGAIFCVVLIHAMMMDIGQAVYAMDFHSAVRLTIFIAAKTCIPLFFMIHGYFLLGKLDEPTGDFLKGRLLKVLMAFLVWSLIFSLWKVFYLKEHITVLGEIRAVSNGSYFHLWFLAVLLRIMFFVPVMRKLVMVSSKKFLLYAVLLCFLWASVIPCIKYVHGGAEHTLESMFFGFFGFYFLGHILGTRDFSVKILTFARVGFVAALAVSMAGIYYFTRVRGTAANFFISYLAPNIVVLSVCAFILLKERFTRSQPGKLVNSLAGIGQVTLGIYLTHVIFLELSSRVHVFRVLRAHLPGTFVLVLMIMAASMFFIKMVQKIPVLRRALSL